MARIALLGGTGHEGMGLAVRFLQARAQIIVGSRRVERAEDTARTLLRMNLHRHCKAITSVHILGLTLCATAPGGRRSRPGVSAGRRRPR